MSHGRVFLVGAGPGDPKLITVRGVEALQKADAVVYDRLASIRLLKYVRTDAELYYVGKRPERHTLNQDEINRLLVDLALAGKTVARLKGGDPCIFGRVGEEAELLRENGILYEIIPGITSAIAVPIYAGIPVTHRDYSSSLAIVTGHEDPTKENATINWEKLATAVGTIVFLMGVSNLEKIRDQLIRYGRSPDTPAALISWGTKVEQSTIAGTLDNIAELAKEAKLQPPAIIIVGEVVKLRERLKWFEDKPLFGSRILVTRSRTQASDLSERIDELGGEPVELPVIRTETPSDPERLEKLDQALTSLAYYDWILFTSVNGVEFFFRRLKHLGLDIRNMVKARIAAVGVKTAEALADRGLIVDTYPGKFQAEDLLDALIPKMNAGQRVLLPKASIARDILPRQLRANGMHVTEADVYDTVIPDELADEVMEMLQNGDIHIATFTSSSTVTNFVKLLEKAGCANVPELMQKVKICCIGPVTAQTAEEAGFKVARVAGEATIASLTEAILELKSEDEGGQGPEKASPE